MQRFAVGIEYLGTGFSGWQRQDHAVTVQQTVEAALAEVAAHPVALTGAGRTDAGVHAAGQTGHFESDAVRELRAWLLGANRLLPPTVNLTWVQPVPAQFHARYSALSRTYRYVILNRPVRSALLQGRAWWVHGALDSGAMQAAARSLLGEHDFSAFRAAECQAVSPVREVRELSLHSRGELLILQCRANAFLHHMVRNIVGSLVRIGRGQEPVDWLRAVLEGRDRRAAGMTAPAHGLCLVDVEYPQRFRLPPPAPGWPRDL